jgi:hypothetical protein
LVGLVIVGIIARVIWNRVHQPIGSMAAPSAEPFLLRYARQAAREQRLVWIKYRLPGGPAAEGLIEIYHTTWTGQIIGWCRLRRRRCAISKNQILAWKLLDERFEPVHNMEAWAVRERWSVQLRHLWEALQRR